MAHFLLESLVCFEDTMAFFKTTRIFCAILLWFCVLCPHVQAAENVGTSAVPVNTAIPQSLPGTEITEEDMQKAFPAPMQGESLHMDFIPHAAPLIPVLPISPAQGQNDKQDGDMLGGHAPQAKEAKAEPQAPELTPILPLAPSKQGHTSVTTQQSTENAGVSPLDAKSARGQTNLLPQGNKVYVHPAQPTINTLPKKTEQAQKSLTSLDNPSVEFMVGQMVLAGFSGTELEKESPIVKLVREGKVGGIFFTAMAEEISAKSPTDIASAQSASTSALGGNIVSPTQLRILTAQLQGAVEENSLPLFMAVEQEGGLVQTLRPDLGFAGLAAAARLGQGTVEATEIAARSAGLEMAGLGLNFAFGPAGDVNVNPLNEDVGKRFRSFGISPKLVAAHVQAFARGLWAAKVIPCVRNFPGMGSRMGGFATQNTQTNILQALPDISSSWQRRELEPYAAAVDLQKNMQVAIQPALVYHRAFDALRPVSLSRTLLTGILRNNLHFTGLIVSEDLRALAPFFPLEESVLQAVLAGADILLISATDIQQSAQGGLEQGLFSLLDGSQNLQEILRNELEENEKAPQENVNEEALNTETLSPEALTKALLQQNLQNILPKNTTDGAAQNKVEDAMGAVLGGVLRGNMGGVLGGAFSAKVQEKPLGGQAADALRVYEILLQHVQAGRIPMERVRQAWQRIYKAKQALKK